MKDFHPLYDMGKLKEFVSRERQAGLEAGLKEGYADGLRRALEVYDKY